MFCLSKKLKTDQTEKKQKLKFFQTEEILAANETVINIIGNKEVSIDGCKGVIDYYDNLIKIKLIKGAAVFSGSALTLCEFSDSGAVIRGNIESIEFVAR